MEEKNRFSPRLSVALSLFSDVDLFYGAVHSHAPVETRITVADKDASVVLDLNSLTQYPDKCSESPKMTKVLSRKGSNRMERQIGEDLEKDDSSKRIVIKVRCSQFDELKQAEIMNKALLQAAANMASLSDSNGGRNKRFNRLRTLHPRSILLLFATLSIVGTILLIYVTLAINLGEV